MAFSFSTAAPVEHWYRYEQATWCSVTLFATFSPVEWAADRVKGSLRAYDKTSAPNGAEVLSRRRPGHGCDAGRFTWPLSDWGTWLPTIAGAYAQPPTWSYPMLSPS